MASVHEIFTKTLPEDVVSYKIYLSNPSDDDAEKVLEEYGIKCLALAASLTSDYIWHNEGFSLCLSKSSEEDVFHLHGMTNFGDFIEDEWLIVSLLINISSTFEKLICSVQDNDGEFLLIEAAEVLPKWLNPDTSKNRVFIHNGRLHIIPVPRTPGEITDFPTGPLSLLKALNIISRNAGLTQAHLSVNESIRRRLDGFPARASQYVQKTNVFVPYAIAQLLDQDPNLVSAAVRAFYYRDPVDLKSCRLFKHFPPEGRVWCQIPINRCSYAQLMQQVFQADKRSGYAVPKNVGSDFKGMDLGSKISHGFQILCSGCSEGKSQHCSGFDDDQFQKYVRALRQRDYFREEVEGSRLYKELMDNARNYFSKSVRESVGNSDRIGRSIGRRILSMLGKSNAHTLSRLVKHTFRTDLPEEDDDEWMYLTEKKMDDVLHDMKEGFAKLNKKNVVNLRENSAELELADLGKRMQSFVNKMSSYEGVEVPTSSEVNFDKETFSESLEKILGVADANESLESDSDEFLTSESDSLESESEDIKDIMDEMDKELASTHIGQSFVKENVERSADDDANMDAYKPVDLDMNLVQNFLDSCSSEIDLPGPATNLLQTLGLPVNGDNS